MPFGLDQLGGFDHDSPEDAFQIPEDAPFAIRKLDLQFDRSLRDLDFDAAEAALLQLPVLVGNPPAGATPEMLIKIVGKGSRCVADIVVTRARTNGIAGTTTQRLLEPLTKAREMLLVEERRNAPGAVRASCVIAGVEAETHVVLSRVSRRDLGWSALGIKKGVAVLLEHYHQLLSTDLDGVARHQLRVEESLAIPMKRFVDKALERGLITGRDSRLSELDDVISAVVVDRGDTMTVDQQDHDAFASLLGAVIASEIESRLLNRKSEDVVDALFFEKVLVAAAGRAHGRLHNSASALGRLGLVTGSAAKTVHQALMNELDEQSQPTEAVDKRERCLLVASYAYQSMIIGAVDPDSNVFRVAANEIVNASSDAMSSLSRRLDRILDQGLELPEGTCRIQGNAIQVDGISPDGQLGVFVRQDLWDTMDRLGMTRSLGHPESEKRWKILWHDLANQSDTQNLRRTLNVTDDRTERALGDAVSRSRLALTVMSLGAEADRALAMREYFLNLYDEARADRHSELAPMIAACADQLTSLIADFAQRVSIDDDIVRKMSAIDDNSPHQRAPRSETALAIRSVASLERVMANRAAQGQYVPRSFYAVRLKLIDKFGLVDSGAFGSSVEPDSLPRPEDSSY